MKIPTLNIQIFLKNKIRKLKKKIKYMDLSFLSLPVYCFYKLLTATLRYKEIGRKEVDNLHDQGKLLVFCLWHDELFPLPHMKKQLDIVTVVSPSSDGAMLAKVLEKLGLRTVRGSSTRQGANALLNAVKAMKNEKLHACVTLDGPLGPRHHVKEGALFLAFHAKALIVPVRISMKKSYAFNTWDKFKIPLPFSSVDINFAPAYAIEANELNSTVLAEEKNKLQDILGSMIPNK